MKIKAKNLYFSYGDQPVLQNVCIELTADQPVVLLGGSGMGKTTLLRILAGLMKADAGEIEGIDKNTRIAVMYQEDRLFPHLTVYKNLKLIRPGVTREEAAGLLAELNLEAAVLDQLPRELSGGMRRRIALARALLFEADLVLMDEPFQGLDVDTRRTALAAVKKWTKGRPLMLISHEPEDGPALGAKTLTIGELGGCDQQER
ncbi:MAG: ABC transporter ATP-binding protein [Firmicutes bacterium]|nr:ABC transporter ATP-binding protein [Bacillota bacterium]